MMKYLLNVSLVFISLNVAAQANYQSGYIVNKNNDTIKGFISYKNLDFTIQTIQFKRTKEDKTATPYTPADIRGFVIAPYDTYISYSGQVSTNKNRFPDIDLNKDTTLTPAMLFLQQVISGPNATLYTNTDKLKIRFFLKEKNALPVELIYYEYGNPTERTYKNSIFTGQLIEIYSKYNTINEAKVHALQSTEFTQGSLENALSIINNNITDKKLRAADVRFFIGASIASVSSTVTNILGEPNTSKSSNIVPKISLGVDLVSNPNVQKFTIRGELSFSYLKPSYTFSYSPNGYNFFDNNTYRFDQYTVSFTPQFLYNVYNSIPFKFFVGIGASVDYSFYNNNVVNYYNLTSTQKPITETSPSYSPFSDTFTLYTGVILNKSVQLSAFYSPTVTTTANGLKGTSLKTQSVGAGIHYIFK